MSKAVLFADHVEARKDELSQTEKRVARHFAENRHQVLVQSAMQLAKAIGTSDATVIRTARALGFDGLEGMRQMIAGEFDEPVSPASRISRTIEETGGDLQTAFETTIETQLQAITALRDKVHVNDYIEIVRLIAEASETAIFGIGPSASVANYFCCQLRRFGLTARPMAGTGLLLADDLLSLKSGSLVIIMAYSRVYSELEVLIDHAQRLGLDIVLITDNLGDKLRQRVRRVISVPRGQTDAFSLHTGTVAFLENVLVGVATLMPQATIASLDELNRLRGQLAGRHVDIGPDRSDKK